MKDTLIFLISFFFLYSFCKNAKETQQLRKQILQRDYINSSNKKVHLLDSIAFDSLENYIYIPKN